MHNNIPTIFTFISRFTKEKIINLDKNIGIILRNYTEPLDKKNLKELVNFCKNQNRKLYLSNNLKIAANFGFDGVYLPSFNKELGLKKFNFKKNFIIMGSAHNLREINFKKKQGVQVIFLSPLFITKNYKKNLGVIKFNILTKITREKIIALGGINANNIKKLKITNAYGFSAISYFE